MKEISEFKGEYEFLSNFYPSELKFGSLLFPTVEHAFQAAKCKIITDREHFTNPSLSPGKAKKLGRHVELRPDWEQNKVSIMYWLVHEKFTKYLILRGKLLETGDAKLIEGNTWNDTFWGVCRGVGENTLGRILMDIRRDMRLGKI